MKKERFFSFLLYFCTSLSIMLGAAHFYRAGLYSLSLLCLLFIPLSFFKEAYIRNILTCALVVLSLRYAWVTVDFIQMRQAFNEPWLRLFYIMFTVSFFILANAFYIYSQKKRYTKNIEFSNVSSIVFFLIFVILTIMHIKIPHILLANRFFPSFGIIQGFFIALWGAYLARKLLDKNVAELWRLRAWRIFSTVFFLQFFLALMGYTIFLMGENFHFPIPGMIIAGALYRESGFFMPILFLSSFMLVGSAWCSHLCYFGVWDSTNKKGLGYEHVPAKKIFSALPYIVFLCMLVFVFICKCYDVPIEVIISLIILLGLIFFPLHFFISRPYGISSYCLYICPLGLIMRFLNKITSHFFSWHVYFTESCVQCGVCIKSCRYAALSKDGIASKTIASSCTLCRNCMQKCRKNGIALSFCGFKGHDNMNLHTIFTVMITILHALFLAVAMV